MQRMWRLSLVVLILVACVGCDRAAKAIAKEELGSSPPISLWNDSVRFEYTENSGAFLGLGSRLPSQVRFVLLVLFAGAGLVLTLVYLVRMPSPDWLPLVGLSLLSGGGIGNLIDRILNQGAVTDFVSIGWGPLRTGVFNLADVAIVAGVIALFLWSALEGRKGQATTGDEGSSAARDSASD